MTKMHVAVRVEVIVNLWICDILYVPLFTSFFTYYIPVLEKFQILDLKIGRKNFFPFLPKSFKLFKEFIK